MKRSIKAATLAALLPLVLAGCGDSDKSGDFHEDSKSGDAFSELSGAEIRDAALADMKEVTSFTRSGTLKEHTKVFELETSSDSDGHCVATTRVNGAESRFVVTDGTYYFSANEAYLRETGFADRDATEYSGKWTEIPAADRKRFDDLCDHDELTDEFSANLEFTVGEVSEVGGQDAVELVSEDGSTYAWVATEGKHHLLKVSGKNDGGAGGFAYTDGSTGARAKVPYDEFVPDYEYTFTDYDVPVDVEAPAAEDMATT